MQQCFCTAAVLISAWNLAASLPAIAGLTPIHHRDSRPGIHLSGLIVQSICPLYLHQAPRDEKSYAAHFSG